MATKANTGFYNGDVLVYKSYSGTLYGVKALKEVYIDAINEYRWMYQGGRIEDNKFIGGKDVSISTSKDLKDGYDLIWTPDKRIVDPKKGDILVGLDGDGKRVVLFYENETSVHRVTEASWGTLPQSSAPLSFYEKKMTGLKILTENNYGRKFSEVTQ